MGRVHFFGGSPPFCSGAPNGGLFKAFCVSSSSVFKAMWKEG
jgi:hypothetical protein